MIPQAILDDIERVLAQNRSGTILLHVQQGACNGEVRAAEWQVKVQMGLDKAALLAQAGQPI